MATRFACWVIVAGNTPTSFRSRLKDDLLPTLRQLQRSQPDTTLKWFDRGRLWSSPLEADEALLQAKRRDPSRSKGWRPGGAHVDPRAKYKITRDEKRARWRKRAARPAGSAPARRRTR